ncbi:hypothetical protein NG819_21675 (plasmid) [Pseudarthrobacter sp. Fe7]|nr:hypothetical protein NG819_21675 [Pseudarthrobacter sp. Fe7]
MAFARAYDSVAMVWARIRPFDSRIDGKFEEAPGTVLMSYSEG